MSYVQQCAENSYPRLKGLPQGKIILELFIPALSKQSFLWNALGGLAETKLQELQNRSIFKYHLGYYLPLCALNSMVIPEIVLSLEE